MVSDATLTRLQAEFDSPAAHIAEVVRLLQEGAPPQFIARFRREETGDLGEERIAAIADRLQHLQEQEARKAAILDQADKQGGLDDEVRELLVASHDQDFIDDVYQAFRPRRRTLAVQAEERGVGPLALAVHHRTLGEQSPLEAAAAYVSEEQGMPTPEAVLEQVALILAERYGTDPRVRMQVRSELSRGNLRAEVVAAGKKGAERYRSLFELDEPVRRVSASRMLALRRAEWEGILKLHLHLPDGRAREILRQRFAADLTPGTPLAEFLDLVFDHAYEHHVWPHCEADVRRRLKEKADRDTVRTLARSYRSQLMAPPLGARRAMGIRTSGKAAWLVALAEDGSLLDKITVEAESDEQRQEAARVLAEMIQRNQVAAVAIPHGRRQPKAQHIVEAAVAQLDPAVRPMVVPVDEGASAIWGSSVAGKKAMPDADVGVRSATSLARRLQDPMNELLHMDMRTLGFGHSIDDVHQRLLQTAMDAVVRSCVARVGVDVNRAGAAQLARVPGVDHKLAETIVAHRGKHGPFRTLAALTDVDGIDDARFAHIAGFLRVHGGDQPLDAVDLHPERYEFAEQIAAKAGKTAAELVGRDTSMVPIREWIEAGTSKRLLREVLDALQHADRDVRGEVTASSASVARSLADLTPGMELDGRVTNLTEFGAFLDIGVGHDGLLHVSQIPRERLQDGESMLCVGEVLRCFVSRVEPDKKRISLSLHKPRPEGVRDERGPSRPRRPRGEGRTRFGGRPGDGERRGPPREGRPVGRFGGGGPRRGGGPPRVITIESNQQRVEAEDPKGNLRSLSALRNLLGGGGDRPQPSGE